MGRGHELFRRHAAMLFTKGDGYGHTGFTGTSVWIDPGTKTAVIVLTNRVHPDDKGNVTPPAPRGGHHRRRGRGEEVKRGELRVERGRCSSIQFSSLLSPLSSRLPLNLRPFRIAPMKV